MKKFIKGVFVYVLVFFMGIIYVNADINDYTYDEIPEQTYTGKVIKPEVVIKKGDTVLVENTDYTLSYSNNTKVGNASINVTGSEENSDLVLTLNFKISYKITYYLNGGINNTNNPTYYNGKSAVKLAKPTREGYTFVGWFLDKKFKKKATSIKKGNIKVYAKWKPNVYNVKFNANGGKGKLANLKNKKYGSSFKLPANKFTKKGAKFVGWNTKKDGTGTSYSNKASVKNLISKNKGTVTLYAEWEYINYKLSYNLNGGVNNEENPAEYYINSSLITLKDPTRDGYVFAGWYKESTFKNKVTSINTGSTGSKNFYAKWTKILLYVDKTELSITDTGIITVQFFGNGKISYKIDNSNIATGKWDTSWFDGNKINLNLTAKNPGTTNVTISNTNNSETKTIKVTVLEKPDPWEGVTVEIPNEVGDDDTKNNRMTITHYNFAKYSSSSYKMYLTFNLTKYGSTTRTNWGTYAYFYDEYGNIIDKGSIYAGSLSLGTTYNDDFSVPINTKKIRILEYPENGQSIPNETLTTHSTTKGPWDNVIVEIPSTFGDDDTPQNRMRAIHYNFAKYSSSSYKMYLEFRLVEYGATNRSNWGTYAYFYDINGNILNKGSIYAGDLALGNNYIDDFTVPNETYRIVINEYPVPVDPSIVSTSDIEMTIPETIGDVYYYENRMQVLSHEFTETSSNNILNLSMKLVKYDTEISKWRYYVYFYNKSNELIGKQKIELSDLVLNNTYSETIYFPKNTKKIVFEKHAEDYYLNNEVYIDASMHDQKNALLLKTSIEQIKEAAVEAENLWNYSEHTEANINKYMNDIALIKVFADNSVPIANEYPNAGINKDKLTDRVIGMQEKIDDIINFDSSAYDDENAAGVAYHTSLIVLKVYAETLYDIYNETYYNQVLNYHN